MSKKEEKIDIDSLIKLSAIEITEEEKEYFKKELSNFLEYAEIINSVDCNKLQPASHAVEKEAYLRDDIPIEYDKLESLLNNAPYKEGTSYIVPPQKGRTGKEKELGEAKFTDQNVEYEAVIGLEVHAHLKTKSKLFCNCSTEFGKSPNANTCPVCTGQPGVLPVLNKEAVNMAIMAGLAMNCKINHRSIFARKNYFYPDLPKAYQISQYEEPLCSGGWIDIEIDGKIKRIRLNRIHMEEDAGKMVHVGAPGIWGSKASAVDYNRSSVPLIEIVSEPDINSAKEAKEYVIMLRSILVSLGICDGNLEEGSLRCDANISIRPKGTSGLGVKTEIKNMNSFKAIERAIDFEIERQIKLKKSGKIIEQETRLWDEASQKTYTMRTKEESHDYRYFPDPDLLPLIVEDKTIEELRKKIGLLPLERKKIYIEKFNLTEDEARLLITNPKYADYFDKCLKNYANSRNLANWFFNELLSFVSGDIELIHIKPEEFIELLVRIDNNEISGKIGKYIISKSFEIKKSFNLIIEEEGLKQITDERQIEAIINKILENNQSQVKEYKSGKSKVFGFFVGEIMKETKGKANPKMVNEILKRLLDS
ncbi:MAG TPA: Asp-tRNA(Asn)/Glu-tRNA(Gln) amidotransferase subunit GatB [Spirochaetota bacterium]|nr:Asp-tRNA(Asn)/Glu-tRNA(Gln) amidotransferase subunit GatB [Spirochaetota bacterium]HOL58163.1 Asp-tRNA(Asn)/Glu-tRNA(Gln) amidotransferase subunit GatB [Spirochaetota bacterium]HPP05020.1 Asp-tRNA(Asn)/Glu-tRNA(Gln) amidotransferase subunit GatB [Spirochaetota bacterium]